jgi:hypothetical protein
MRKMFFSVLVVVLCTQLASADYANPPDWQNDPLTQNFTHQSWSFTNQQANPMVPDDGGDGNLYGDPEFNMTAANSTWLDDLGMVYDLYTQTPLGQRQGGWRVDGPSGTPGSVREEWFTIDIPNIERDLIKEVWIELTFLVTDLTHANTIVNDVDLQVYADDNKFDYLGSTEEPLGASMYGEIWVRSAAMFSYFPQPGSEKVVLTGWMLDGQHVILDQIDIDTRCVPEPTAMGLLGIGTIALIRRRKNH